MVIPPPDVRTKLQPLLACLPTAFASSRPPPVLFPQLSPTLQQRVQLLSATAEKPTNSWLPLLCWEPGAAKKLLSVVESEAFELHPVSGEIEYGEAGPLKYRRLDEETLQAKVDIADLDLVVVFVWTQGDQEGGGDSWKVCEVSPLQARSEHSTLDWCPSITVAEAKAKEVEEEANEVRGVDGTVREATGEDGVNADGGVIIGGGYDDDAYWAQYDKTPGRTPGNRSSMPGPASNAQNRGRSASEAAYFAQYSQVQPEMDNDDPSQERAAIGESSLNGSVLSESIDRGRANPLDGQRPSATDEQHLSKLIEVNQSRPSPAIVSPLAANDVKRSTAPASASDTAIKQRVSSSIKSLFRLCRNAGIERSDFEELVHTELETLSLLDEGE